MIGQDDFQIGINRGDSAPLAFASRTRLPVRPDPAPTRRKILKVCRESKTEKIALMPIQIPPASKTLEKSLLVSLMAENVCLLG